MKKQRLFTLLVTVILLAGTIGTISGPSVAVAAPSQQGSSADLSVTKTDSPDPLIFGNPLSYTLTVTNHGPLDATGVTATDTLPLGVTFGSATPSQGNCSGTSTVTCTLGSLANGATATVTIVVTPTVTGTITNTVSMAGNESDSNMANNSDTITSTVNPIVYAVIAIDAENSVIFWDNYQYDPNPEFDTHDYKHSDPQTVAIFSEPFRNAHLDSFGEVFKMSWFAKMDQEFEAATYLDESPEFPELTGQPVGYTGVMDTLLRYWGDEVEQFGDGIYWHHHVLAWTGSAWEKNDAVINGYTHHFDALNEMLIGRSYFPSVYRAGWLWENMAINTFLNDWVPFDYTYNAWWGNWAPYHPNTSNPWSSAPPNLDRWMTRCDGSVSQSNINTAFNHAQTNGAAVYCLYFHNRDNMPSLVNSMHLALLTAAANYPGVRFKYVNALDGMQNILGFTDRTPPVLGITRLDASTYQITSDEPVWQDTPYVAARYASADGEHYEHVSVTPAGINTWQASTPPQITITPPEEPPEPQTFLLQTVGVGASDVYGNPDVALYHVIPTSIEISPAEETVMAGEVVTYTATGQDDHGITWDVTVGTTFTITPAAGGSWVGNFYTSEVTGDWTVTGGYADLSDTATLHVEPAADLSVTKTNSPDPVIAGAPLTYTLTVTNHGPSDATGVTLTDTLPSAVTFGSATPSQGGCSGTTTVTCDLGDLADSTTATVTIAVTPMVTGTVSNTASVTGNEFDPNMGNNTDTAEVTVISPTIEITKEADQTVVSGSDVTFSITVTNTGDVALSDVTVTDALALDCNQTFVSLAAEESVSYTCVAEDVTADFTNSATAEGTDPTGGTVSNTDTAEVTVINPAIEVVKEASVTTASVSETITYTYTVENTGDVPLINVHASDDRLGAISLDSTTLALGEITTGTTTYLVDESDLPGPLTNTVTVTGTPPVGAEVSHTDAVTVHVKPPNTVYLPLIIVN